MSSDDHNQSENETAGGDEWEEFRGEDSEPIGVKELKHLNLADMAEDSSSG